MPNAGSRPRPALECHDDCVPVRQREALQRSSVHVLTMVSLSQQFARGGGPEDLFVALAAAVGATRMWAHTTELLAIDARILLLHATLYCSALVPRAHKHLDW